MIDAVLVSIIDVDDAPHGLGRRLRRPGRLGPARGGRRATSTSCSPPSGSRRGGRPTRSPAAPRCAAATGWCERHRDLTDGGDPACWADARGHRAPAPDRHRDRAPAGRRRRPRLATLDADGFPHVTPIWFLWDGTRSSCRACRTDPHVGRLRADLRAGIVIDVEDPERPDGGAAQPAGPGHRHGRASDDTGGAWTGADQREVPAGRGGARQAPVGRRSRGSPSGSTPDMGGGGQRLTLRSGQQESAMVLATQSVVVHPGGMAGGGQTWPPGSGPANSRPMVGPANWSSSPRGTASGRDEPRSSGGEHLVGPSPDGTDEAGPASSLHHRRGVAAARRTSRSPPRRSGRR